MIIIENALNHRGYFDKPLRSWYDSGQPYLSSSFMPLKTLTHQTIALAGVAQATALVQQLATTGTADTLSMETSIASILKIDAPSVLDVYGGLANLRLGLAQLHDELNGYKSANAEQARYAAALVFLTAQFAERTKMIRDVHIGVTRAQAQAEYFGLLHENVLANLADVYSQSISTLQPRIMVNGHPDYLSRAEIANKIRACLLAGVRSVWLWRQCGGTRWKFLFYRKKIQTELKYLLQQID